MNELIIEKLVNEIKNEQDSMTIHRIILDYHPYDVAFAFKRLNKEDRFKIYVSLSHEEIADIFEYLDETEAITYLEEMNVSEGAKILNEMETDEAVNILNEMNEEGIDKYYLDSMPEDDSAILNRLTKYSSDEAGSVMGTNYIDVECGTSIKDTMKLLVKNANESEVIDPIFVTKNKELVGIILLKDLIISRAPSIVDDIMDTSLVYCNACDSIEDVTKMIKDYNLLAIPVLEDKVLVGVVTIDDAIDEAIDDVKNDFDMMAGVTGEIDKKTNVFSQILKRIPWLVCLLIISLLISNITSKFEDVIVEVTIFAFFQSMIFDMAGNAGTQSLAVTVRSISRKDLSDKKSIRHHLGKELLTSIITGFILGVISFITSFIYMEIFSKGIYVEWLVALIISVSLMLSLVLTEMLGTIVPIIFSKIKIDPAVASGPLITTLSDAISIIIYFGLATIFMNLILVGGAL